MMLRHACRQAGETIVQAINAATFDDPVALVFFDDAWNIEAIDVAPRQAVMHESAPLAAHLKTKIASKPTAPTGELGAWVVANGGGETIAYSIYFAVIPHGATS